MHINSYEMERSIWRYSHMTIYVLSRDATRVSTSRARCPPSRSFLGVGNYPRVVTFSFCYLTVTPTSNPIIHVVDSQSKFRVRHLGTKVGLPYALYPTAPTTRSSRPSSTRFPHHVPLPLFSNKGTSATHSALAVVPRATRF